MDRIGVWVTVRVGVMVGHPTVTLETLGIWDPGKYGNGGPKPLHTVPSNFAEFQFAEFQISVRGHSRSYILAAIESPCTNLCRPLIVT